MRIRHDPLPVAVAPVGDDPNPAYLPLTPDVDVCLNVVANLCAVMNRFRRAGDTAPGHRHHFDHSSLLTNDRLRVGRQRRRRVAEMRMTLDQLFIGSTPPDVRRQPGGAGAWAISGRSVAWFFGLLATAAARAPPVLAAFGGLIVVIIGGLPVIGKLTGMKP
jgi:hypothetical protein